MNTISTSFVKSCLLLLLLSFTGLGSLNTQAKSSLREPSLDVRKESLQIKINTLNERKGIDEALKTKLLSIYQSAQDNINNIENSKARITTFNQSIKQAPLEIKAFQRETNQTQARLLKQKLEDYSQYVTADLEQKIINEKGKISALDEQLKKVDSELTFQQSRPAHIREEIVTAKQELESTQNNLEQPVNKTLSKLEIEANTILLKSIIESRSTELKMLEIEAMSNPIRVDLLKAQYKSLDIQKTELTPIVTAIDSLLTNRREKDAQNMQLALTETEKELAGKHPLIQNVARENIQYTRDLQTVNAKIESYTEEKVKVDADAAEINTEFKGADKKISLAAISPELGKMLREERRGLDIQAQGQLQIENTQSETALASLEAYKVDDKIKKISDVDTYIKQLLLSDKDNKITPAELTLVQSELRELFNNQKELLNKLSIDYSTYIRVLGDFEFAKQQMMDLAIKFAKYLDENLLWVKSSDPINLDTPINVIQSVAWFLSPINWFTFIKDIGHLFIENTLLFLIGLATIVGLRLGKQWSLDQFDQINSKINKKHKELFSYTLHTLAYKLIIILPLPFVLGYFGWLINKDIHLDDFSRAMGAGFKAAAIPYLLINYFYSLFTENGVVRKHFDWQKHHCKLLHKELNWLRYVAVITSFIISSTGVSHNPLYSDNLGRLAFIASMVAIAVFWSRILNPTSGLIHKHITNEEFTWVNRLQYVWYPAIYLIPIIIIGFSIAGYYLSALQLQGQLIESMRLLFAAVIIHQVVIRWLTLVNEQLALSNAEEQRKATLLEKQNAATNEYPIIPNTESIIDIPKINAQTTRLLNVFIALGLSIGLWVIWSNLLPAFSFLDDIVLWQHIVIQDEQKSYAPVTLTHLLIAGIYLFIAIVSVRNLSGAMEILVFRRLEIMAGTRYAFNQLANYSIITIAVITITNKLGGSWSELQWLIAALGVGLGFGLQEIFANLVSGIIILFERPIRVNDTVTIGSITGKVSRIQMRATTLIDWDQKEHIVPNKNFITNQLVNWTLSDTITRLEILINVAYGTDLELAHKIMSDCVANTPEIIKEPAPSVIITSFGDNAVVFSIRIFVDEMSNRIPATHNLFINIEKALREHNIQMPYPQRDIHIKSLPKEFRA